MRGTTNSAPKDTTLIHESFTLTTPSGISQSTLTLDAFSDILERLYAIAQDGRMVKWNLINRYTSQGTQHEVLLRTEIVLAEQDLTAGYIENSELKRAKIERYGTGWRLTTSSKTTYYGGNEFIFNFWYMSDVTQA